jgi:RimJ/RimL family protein N-acetyltransferase
MKRKDHIMKKEYFPHQFEGERVVMRKHQVDLASMMFDSIEKDRERLRQFLPWVDHTNSVDDEFNYIKMTQEKWDQYELFDYGIFIKDNDEYAGNIGVHSIAWEHERCELGYWIIKKFEGQGYMSDAVTTLENICFSLGFHRIEIRCSSRNTRSASIPKKLGYLQEGFLREESIEMGVYRSTLVFGKLKSESSY